MYEHNSRFGNTTPVLQCAREHGVSYADALAFSDYVAVGRLPTHASVSDVVLRVPLAAQNDLTEIANDLLRAQGLPEVAS